MKNQLLLFTRINNPALCTALLGAVFLCPVRAHEAAGGDVRIVSTIDSGGSVQSGGDVQITGFVGEPGVVATGGGVGGGLGGDGSLGGGGVIPGGGGVLIGGGPIGGGVPVVSSGNVVVRSGGNSMIYYATGFSVASGAATINEQDTPDTNSTRTQLRGNVVYDDSTLGAVDGAQIAWNAPATNSAIASISATGIAQAATVYLNTNASFSGSYGGVVATNSLTVLNVLPDNFGVYAGDTFDDAWEIGQGMTGAVNPNATNNGVPNWQLYAMGFNPAQPAPATLSSTALTNGYLAVRYSRNPYATNYSFTPQESGNLSAGFVNMVNPVSATNLVSGVEQITTFGSVPINATNRQFLRVKVTQPAP